MANYLQMSKKQQVLALLDLGWAHRRIQRETGVDRGTVRAYERARRSNPAKTFPGSSPRRRFTASVYATAITEKLDAGLTLQRIWQDLAEEYGYSASYESVKRFVRTLAPTRRAVGVFHCAPGAEGQIDFFRGAPTLDTTTGEWRRPWVFRLTLGHSRHGYEEAVWDQTLETFLRLHERAFRDLGGVPKVIRRPQSPARDRGRGRCRPRGREERASTVPWKSLRDSHKRPPPMLFSARTINTVGSRLRARPQLRNTRRPCRLAGFQTFGRGWFSTFGDIVEGFFLRR